MSTSSPGKKIGVVKYTHSISASLSTQAKMSSRPPFAKSVLPFKVAQDNWKCKINIQVARLGSLT